MLPDTIPLTDEQFKLFLEKAILTDQSRRLLDGLTAQNAATAVTQRAEAAAQCKATPPPKTADTAWESHEDEGADEGNGARETD